MRWDRARHAWDGVGFGWAQSAIAMAKRCRPVVDPIGTLPELLRKMEAAYREEPPRARYPEAHFS